MDPMDEFEFKPLTDGLGFHKKAERIKNEIRSSFAQSSTIPSVPEAPPRAMFAGAESGLELEKENALLGRETPKAASRSISDLIASLPPSLDFIETKETSARRPQIFQPLTAPQMIAQAAIAMVPSAPTMPVSSPYRDRLNEGLSKAFPRSEKTRMRPSQQFAQETGVLKPVSGHLMAGVLDAMVVAGVSTLLLVCILAITHVNLTGLLTNAQTDGPTQIHIALLFISGLQLYLLTARSFFGASLGEWAFDIQMGTAADQKKPMYPILVAWRTILVTMTGLVVLPLLSFVFRRDLAKYLTGLQTYRQF